MVTQEKKHDPVEGTTKPTTKTGAAYHQALVACGVRQPVSDYELADAPIACEDTQLKSSVLRLTGAHQSGGRVYDEDI